MGQEYLDGPSYGSQEALRGGISNNLKANDSRLGGVRSEVRLSVDIKTAPYLRSSLLYSNGIFTGYAHNIRAHKTRTRPLQPPSNLPPRRNT